MPAPFTRCSPVMVEQMRILRDLGLTHREIGERLHVERSLVTHHLLHGKMHEAPEWVEKTADAVSAARGGRPEMAAQLLREAADCLDTIAQATTPAAASGA